MAKTVAFKKKPLKSEKTEQKLEKWLEDKTSLNPDNTAPSEITSEQSRVGTNDNPPPSTEQKITKAENPGRQKKEEPVIEIAQVTFHMPKSLQKRLKLECFKQDTTIKDYVITLLDKKLPKDISF